MAMLGAFEIGRVLGTGGSGTVYAARSPSMGGTEIALKVLREDTATTQRERARFMEEAARMRRVSHPSLVPVLDAGFLPDGRPYVAMPLLPGESLAVRVRRGPVPLAEARVLFDDLAGAVSTLHAAGLVHRDIKPENVLVGPRDGRTAATLLDLGIARDVTAPDGTTTQLGNVRGTPAYMAMERFFGTPASVLTDVYELSVTLYVMLTGNLPWRRTEDATERMTPAHPMQVGASLPEPLAQVLLRGLAAKPEARFGSVAELAQAVAVASTGAGFFAGEATAPTALAPRASFAPAPHHDPQGFASTTLAPVQPRTNDAPMQTRSSGGGGGAALIAVAIFGGFALLGLTAVGALYMIRGAVVAPSAPSAGPVLAYSVSIAVPPIAVPSAPASTDLRTPWSPKTASPPPPPPSASSAPASGPGVPAKPAAPNQDDLRFCEGLESVYCGSDYQQKFGGGQCRSFMLQVLDYRKMSPEARANKNKECYALMNATNTQLQAAKKKAQ